MEHIKIKTKYESDKYINKFSLNIFPQIICKNYDEELINTFIRGNKARYYAVRSKTPMSPYQLSLNESELLEYCKNKKNFSINISSYCYKDNQICVGEIRVFRNMDVEYIISNKPGFSLRECEANPDFIGKINICDRKLPKIKGMTQIIDYIFKYELFDLIVEFTVFDCKLGINMENVIIWELRTDY